MDIRYKKKAIIGVIVWLAVIPIGLIIGVIAIGIIAGVYGLFTHHNPDTHSQSTNSIGALFIILLLVHYFSFFWAGRNLARAKGYSSAIVLPGIFWPAQLVILAILLFALEDKFPNRSSSSSRRKRGERESPIARVVRLRRNAFVANVFGVFGILIALALFFLPLGLFETRDNARVAAILTFLPSYAAVMYGCYWWVRAKNWHEAVIFIGLMPLAPIFIPYVRLVYFRTPLLPVGMVIMPIILISVVAVLPDKSGIPKRKRWDRD